VVPGATLSTDDTVARAQKKGHTYLQCADDLASVAARKREIQTVARGRKRRR
jgi:hypothetical protein